MKGKFYGIPYKVSLGNKLPTSFQLILCFVILLGSISPLQAQRSNREIDQLKITLEEAFIKDVVILSTTIVESNEDLPKHIFVRGYTMPSNYFQIRMPVDRWNEKNFIAGCGAGMRYVANRYFW